AFVLIFALIVPVSAGAVSLDQAVKGTGGEPLSSLSTLAGSGVYGDNFEPAVQSGDAVFRSPAGLLVLENGTILIADAKNHRIRQLKDGEVSNYAGFVYLEIDDKGLPIGALVDEQKSAAVFNHPQGMAVDGQGNIYVADTMNHAVRKIDTRGNVSTI